MPDGKNPQQFNRYAYTNNNPIKYIDPSGHMLTACAEGCTWNTEMDRDIRNGEIAKAQKFYRGCAQGGGPECGTLHEVEALSLLAGIGLLGGMAIGAGAGLIGSGFATASTTTSLIGTGLVGGGTGMLVGAGATVVNEARLGQRLDPTDILINSASTGGAGFVAGIIPGSSGAALGLRALFNGLFAANASAWSDDAHGRPVNVDKAVLSGGLTALAGVAAEKIGSAINPAPTGMLSNPQPYSSLATFVGSQEAARALRFGLINAFTIQIPLTVLATPK